MAAPRLQRVASPIYGYPSSKAAAKASFVTSQPPRPPGSARRLVLFGTAVAILADVAARIHALETWHAENYEKIAVTFSILALGCLADASLCMTALARSRGDARSRRTAWLGILGAILIPAAGFLWLVA